METRSSYALLSEAPALSQKHDEFQLHCNLIPFISIIVLAQFILLAAKLHHYLVNNVSEHNKIEI